MSIIKGFMVVLLITFSALASAVTCSEYNAMGPTAANLEELSATQLSSEQISLVRENTSLKAGRVAALQVTPLARKLDRILNDQNLTAQLAGMTSALVRRACFNSPNSDFYETVSEQFVVVVEYLSE